MGRASREKRERKVRRSELGLNGLNLTARARRNFERDLLREVELPREIRADLAEFSILSVAVSLSSLGSTAPDFARARLFREAIQSEHHGTTCMTTKQAASFATRVVNAWDPAVVDSSNAGTLHELFIGRLLSEQLPVQMQRSASLHRALQVLYDPDSKGQLGSTAWNSRLGIDLPGFLLGAYMLAGQLEEGPFSLSEYLDGLPADLVHLTQATLEVLARSCDEIVRLVPRDGYDQYDIRPLAETPIVRIDGDQLCAPAPGFVRLAASPAALYIRLIREDRERNEGRRRSDLVGQRYETYLDDYCAAALRVGWSLIRLDEEPDPCTQIADFALFPNDRSFLVLLETKMRLSPKAAQTGDSMKRDDIEEFYQSSFNQLESTFRSVGQNGFLAEVPQGVPTFGLMATFDQHTVTVVDGRTHFGITLNSAAPSSVGAFAPRLPCIILSADDIEYLVDFFGRTTTVNALLVLMEMFDERTSSPSHAMRRSVADLNVPEREVNPVRVAGFKMLAGAFESPELRSFFEGSF